MAMPGTISRAGHRDPCGSDGANALGLLALRALRDLELHALVLLEGAEAAGLDGREVHEDVLVTAVDVDEPEALVRVEPLHSSLCHGGTPSAVKMKPVPTRCGVRVWATGPGACWGTGSKSAREQIREREETTTCTEK